MGLLTHTSVNNPTSFKNQFYYPAQVVDASDDFTKLFDAPTIWGALTLITKLQVVSLSKSTAENKFLPIRTENQTS